MSDARHGNVIRDLYSEAFNIGSSLRFEKEGQTVHTLRPVSVYVLDEAGNPIEDIRTPIRSNQTWQQ